MGGGSHATTKKGRCRRAHAHMRCRTPAYGGAHSAAEAATGFCFCMAPHQHGAALGRRAPQRRRCA
jgi:hypothetical protein